MKDQLEQLATDVTLERDLLWKQMKRLWEKPLPERIESGRALGHLVINFVDETKRLIHFHPPREDFAIFREDQAVRLSQNEPEHHFFHANFLGLTEHGLTVSCSHSGDLSFNKKDAWSLDEDLVDLSSFYLKAIESLGRETHGREKVFPVLFLEQDNEIDATSFEEAMDVLESDESLNGSQIDAVAVALASSPFHLVQGPPGTGKTHTLARLVQELVCRGERVLITGFTHRAIHNALGKIRALLDEDCPVVKISRRHDHENLPFPIHRDFAESGLDRHPGPYVIGATPFALYTRRLDCAHFDSTVFDETSQLTLPAAIMAMMKSDQWFFFGDHRQLPPVTLVHADNPAEASAFSRLIRQCQPTTLKTTYRLNAPLTHWPAKQFYHGELTSAHPDHRLALKTSPICYADLLDRESSLVRACLKAPGCRSRNEEEAEHVAEIILTLLKAGCPPAEIGVIAPFRAQVSLIRRLLRGDRFETDLWKELTVDTVERFQGQEREVVLYSFTASDINFLGKVDTFLFQAARLNVAVTRARTKVILLHSPEIQDHAERLAAASENAQIFLSLLHEAQLIELS